MLGAFFHFNKKPRLFLMTSCEYYIFLIYLARSMLMDICIIFFAIILGLPITLFYVITLYIYIFAIIPLFLVHIWSTYKYLLKLNILEVRFLLLENITKAGLHIVITYSNLFVTDETKWLRNSDLGAPFSLGWSLWDSWEKWDRKLALNVRYSFDNCTCKGRTP